MIDEILFRAAFDLLDACPMMKSGLSPGASTWARMTARRVGARTGRERIRR